MASLMMGVGVVIQGKTGQRHRHYYCESQFVTMRVFDDVVDCDDVLPFKVGLGLAYDYYL